MANMPLTDIGITPRKASQFSSKGIETVTDLLGYLDQDGQCWVADEAIVFGGSACVKDNALVADKAVCEGSVCEDAVVRGEALIKSKAICMGHSLICDSAIVNGIVRGYATVAEKANVKEGTLVEGDTYYIQS